MLSFEFVLWLVVLGASLYVMLAGPAQLKLFAATLVGLTLGRWLR